MPLSNFRDGCQRLLLVLVATAAGALVLVAGMQKQKERRKEKTQHAHVKTTVENSANSLDTKSGKGSFLLIPLKEPPVANMSGLATPFL